MVRIRLRRVGAKAQPSYRIVVADGKHPRDGRFIEAIGHYNPRTEPATYAVDEARALHWLKVGAQPSEAVDRIFKWTGTAERFERFKQGEALESLTAEAEQAAAGRPPSVKTRPAVAPPSKHKSKRQKAAEAAEAAETASASASA